MGRRALCMAAPALRCSWDWLLAWLMRRGAGNEPEGRVEVLLVALVVLVLVLAANSQPHSQPCTECMISG